MKKINRWMPIVVLLMYVACTKKVTESIAVPTITGVSSNVIRVGDTLVITGGPFRSRPEENLVSIASVAMPVIKASTSQLSVIVASDAKSGQLAVSFASGQAGTYKDDITIIVLGQPYVASITPANAENGDTVVIRGNGFSVPGTNNSVLFNGQKAAILNASDSVIKVVVPTLGSTGPVTVTSAGLTSVPYAYHINRPDPLEDGQIYWMAPGFIWQNEDPYAYVNSSVSLQRGKAIAGNPPFGDELYGTSVAEYIIPDPYAPTVFDTHIYNGIVADRHGNAYQLVVHTDLYTLEKLDFQLVRMSLSGDNFSRTVLKTFTPTTASTSIKLGASNYYFSNNPLTTLAIDGDKLYIKIGVTNDYYTADVSAANPVFNLERGLLTDSASLGPQFGANYIFYDKIGAGPWSLAQYPVKISYLQRGASVSQDVPLNAGEQILSTMADPSHGDTLMIATMTSGRDGMKIYRFVAPTGELTELYNPSNWKDGNFVNSRFQNGNTGFMWAGSHIYYTNKSRSEYSNNTGDYTSNGLYRLNADGSSTKGAVVYGRLEPLTSELCPFIDLFIGPKK